MPAVAITEFTDPGCPFAFSAEPHRLRLRWLFGDQLDFRERMVGLSAQRPQDGEGFTPERMAASWATLSARHGMPMTTELKAASGPTLPACRAVVAARRHAPDREWLLLRHLRLLHFSGPMLDDPQTIRTAAARAGLDPDELERWIAEPGTEDLLQEDLRLARDPTPAARALPGKLARWDGGGWRYTCPSYEMAAEDGATFSAPGFQSALTYETALANLAPQLARRDPPQDVAEVLAWAGVPLASQEVAEVCGIARDEARERLTAAGAREERVGTDGFWTLAG